MYNDCVMVFLEVTLENRLKYQDTYILAAI